MPEHGFASLVSNVDIKNSFDTKPGFQINIGASKAISSRFSIDVGAGYAYYFYQHNYKRTYPVLSKVEGITSTGDRNVVLGDPIVGFYGITAKDDNGNTLYDLSGNPITQDYQTSGSTGTFSNGNDMYPASDEIISNNTSSSNSDIGESKVSYLTVPIHIKYTITPNRLKVSIGAINSFLIYSSHIITNPATAIIVPKNVNGTNSTVLNYYTPNSKDYIGIEMDRDNLASTVENTKEPASTNISSA